MRAKQRRNDDGVQRVNVSETLVKSVILRKRPHRNTKKVLRKPSTANLEPPSPVENASYLEAEHGLLRVWSSGEEQPACTLQVQQELVTDLYTLRDKIRSLVPSVGDDSITLHFVGEDGCKEEYVFKCISQKCERERRQARRCRHCGNAIMQCRYMCVSCINYNLCGGCEAAGVHSEHVMLRIGRPVKSKRAGAQLELWCEQMRSSGADDFFSNENSDKPKFKKKKGVGKKTEEAQKIIDEKTSEDEESLTEMQIHCKSEPESESEDITNPVSDQIDLPENAEIKEENIEVYGLTAKELFDTFVEPELLLERVKPEERDPLGVMKEYKIETEAPVEESFESQTFSHTAKETVPQNVWTNPVESIGAETTGETTRKTNLIGVRKILQQQKEGNVSAKNVKLSSGIEEVSETFVHRSKDTEKSLDRSLLAENHKPAAEKYKKPHIKKPLNAFMLFMKDTRGKVVAECKTNKSAAYKHSAAINQMLGKRWHSLGSKERAKYYELARRERQLHLQLYPNWKLCNKRKKKRKPRPLAEGEIRKPKKCRAKYGLAQFNLWCLLCRRKKKCMYYTEALALQTASGMPASSHQLSTTVSSDNNANLIERLDT